MKILLVSPLPPPSGGLATWTQELIEYAPQLEIEISVVNTALIGERIKLKNGKMSVVDEIIRSVRIVQALRKKLRKEKYNVVHINTVCSPKGMLRDLVCAYSCGHIPMVLQCHCNVSDWVGKSKLSISMLRKLVRIANKTLVLNSKSQEAVKSITDCESIRVPNFITVANEIVNVTIRDRVERIVFVGRVRIEKGIGEIFQAAAQLPDIYFGVIGSIDKRVNALERPVNVELLGEKSHADVAIELSRADVFLFPSYSEGFSIALLEAMHAGLPIIATDVGANADMLEKHGGIIVPTKNIEAIVAAINRMKCFELRRAMSAYNTNKVAMEYSIDSVGKKLRDIYASVAADYACDTNKM